MKPRGPLMIEHRLIEKMLYIIAEKIPQIQESKCVDPNFIDIAVDFIRIYADKTHHGKEEDIMFRDCKKKKMNDEDNKVMNELIEEHKYGRKTVAELVRAKEEYLHGKNTIDTIVEKLTALTVFYPKHILKEDKLFFINSEKYFTENELEQMLREFWEFDKAMIHYKYNLLVKELQNMNE